MAWTDPYKLWKAIRSKEKLIGVVHGKEIITDVDNALSLATRILKATWMVQTVVGLRSFLWCIAVLLAVLHPLIGVQIMGREIVNILRWFVLLGALLSAWRSLDIAANFRRIKKQTLKMSIVEGIPALPPVTAWGVSLFRMPTIKWAWRAAVIMVALNMIVIGSVMNPAVVTPRNGQPYKVENIQMVVPFTSWDIRPKLLKTTEYAIIAAPNEDNIWVYEFEIVVYHKNSLVPAGAWAGWIERRMAWVLGQLRQSATQDMPIDLSPEEQAQFILDRLGTSEYRQFLEQYLGRSFNTEFEHLQIQHISIRVRYMTLSEYYDIIKRQRRREANNNE